MFIGREQEKKRLQETLRSKGAAVMIYGKRKVGKTALILEALKNHPHFYYECVRGTMEDNLTSMTAELVRAGVLSTMISFPGFRELFAYLKSLSRDLIIVIDEYPYLKTFAPAGTVDSVFQSIIDQDLDSLRLILCGSHVGMMKEMLEEKNALYGRFQLVLRLHDLDYRTASCFYSGKSAYEKIGIHSVFGGTPYVLRHLNPDAALRENIVSTVLNEEHPVSLYASRLLISDYSIPINAERIFGALGNGRKHYKEIESQLGMERNGNLAKQLKVLGELELVQKNAPINYPEDSRKACYEMNDNLLRFYFSYIYRNISALRMIGADAFYDSIIQPTLITFISHRFEAICREYFSLRAREGKLPGIHHIGTYYYDDPVHKRNGEFDIALDWGEVYSLYEAKYVRQALTLDEIHREQGQVREIPNLCIKELGFISASGFAEMEPGAQYITGDDLYSDA